MPLANPLPAASFADLFKVGDVSFVQGFQQQRSAQGGGNTAYADRAPSLWKAEITTVPMLNAEAEGVMALINSRGGGLKTALLHNYKLPFPVDDPDGTLFGAYTPTILTIASRIQCSFAAFPPNYKIALGTYFGLVFDTSRYYLGQFVEARTANGTTGNVTSVEIWPPLPASVTAGTTVTVLKPPAKCRIIPGSAYPSVYDGMNSTIKFSAEQTYSK